MLDDHHHVHEGHGEDDPLLIGAEAVDVAGGSVGDAALDQLGFGVKRVNAVP